jgi:hypothetical protein
MAIKSWNGSSGAFETAAAWSPAGIPAAGDYAIINSGLVTEGGAFADFLTLRLTASASNSPRLVLAGATLPATSRLEIAGTDSSASVQVQGQVSNLGTITVTSNAPGSATFLVRDADNGGATTLLNAGTIAITDGIAQFLNFGGNATRMTNNGLVSVASTGATASSAYVSLSVDGTGRTVIGNNSTAEFAASVGAGQTVAFQPGSGSGVLQLDTAGTFQGTIRGFVSTDRIGFGAIAAPAVSYTSTSATGGVVHVTSSGNTVADLNVRGVYAPTDFSIATTDLGGGRSDTALATTATNPLFNYTDNAAGTSGTVAPDLYDGPVNYLQWQYIWDRADGVAISATRSNVFLHGASGDDALAVQGGNNVVDGGGGSNFLVGGNGADGGTDTFFVDGRGGVVTWSSVVNFHHGDAVTIFGFTAGTSTLPFTASDGAAGYTGVTLHSELSGAGTGVNGSVTFAGISLEDAQTKFTISSGSVGGADYLSIAYTG